MSSTLKSDTDKKLPVSPWGSLPPRMRVLFITGSQRTGGWLAEAFAADSASDVLLEEAFGMAAGLALLRDEIFDAVLISHDGEELDAFNLLDAIRAGSSQHQPIVVLGSQSQQDMSAFCFEAGGDAYVCVDTATTRSLIWHVARAVERHQLIDENRRLQQLQQHRLHQERQEAGRLLQQQRELIADADPTQSKSTDDSSGATQKDTSSAYQGTLPESFAAHYQELLQAYIIMGSGNMSQEMNTLADLLASVDVTANQAMNMHIHVLQKMIDGLGSRSARHVMNRANLLILELMIDLAEGYRERLHKSVYPLYQQMLPGF